MIETSLPTSWERPQIDVCCDLNPRLDKAAIADSRLVHFVPMPAVEALTNKVDVKATRPFAEVKKGYTPFLSGDVIFAKITPCMENGKVAVVPDLEHDIALGSTEFHVIRPLCDLPPLWFFYYLSSRAYRSEAEHNMTGAVGQRRVPIDFIAQSKIPLPPLAEQRRIVAKIEELFSELDAGEESLRRARRQLGVYRQSLLKQAFEGKLTAPWRENHPDLLESPDQLLARIAAARDALYQKELEDWKRDLQCWEDALKTGKRPSKPRQPEEPDPPSTEHRRRQWEIPTSWAWTQVGFPFYVTKLAGFEYTEFVTYDDTGDLKVLKAENAGPEGFRHTQFSRVHSESVAMLTRSVVSGGDLLVVFVGNTGNVATVPFGDSFFLGPNIGMARSYTEFVNTRYVELFLRSPSGRDMLLAAAKAVAQPSLSMGTIRQCLLALPSLPEQREIVRLLDEQFTVIEQNEREIDAALKRSAALRQSILKKAFTGQLVPQDPTDEPASALLERIRAEREATAILTKPQKKVAKKKISRNRAKYL